MITKEKLIVALKIALVGYEKNVGNGYDREYEFILDEDFAQIADDLIDAVNEPENIPDIDDYPVTDSRTYKNLDGTVNWKKYAMALRSYILNEPENPTDEEIEKWAHENSFSVNSTINKILGAKWMRNKLRG
jgi:hypothetical protein